MGAGKKAEAVATVVAAVDQARIREPREPRHLEESYAQQTTLDYGYKEQVSITKVAEHPQRPASEPQVVPKAAKPEVIQAPSETHITTTDQMGMQISSQVSPYPLRFTLRMEHKFNGYRLLLNRALTEFYFNADQENYRFYNRKISPCG